MKKKINIILNKFAAIWLLMILINCPWPVINSCILSMVIFFVKNTPQMTFLNWESIFCWEKIKATLGADIQQVFFF